MTLSSHLSRYPKARSSTLAHIIAKQAKTEQLRKEVRAMKLRRLLSFFAWTRPSEGRR